MPEYVDPKYRESVAGNPQYADVKIVRATQGAKPRPVGATSTPMKKERMGAVRKWKPKGRK